jgi:diacylglycerol kinase (ATP)
LNKQVSLFHNPDAGSSDHSQKELRKHLEEAGFSVIFSTTEAGDVKKVIPDRTDYVAIAGGDGMIRKVVDQMLERRIIDGMFTLGVIPLGTANNIARTLGLPMDPADVIVRWRQGNTRQLDTGRISGLKDRSFFLEGLGCGLVPLLIKDMKDKAKKPDTPEKELDVAMQQMLKVAANMKPQLCTLEVDGVTFRGRLLLAEIMNIKTVGPNLLLAPDADPSDGLLDVVYITEDDRQALMDFIQGQIDGREKPLAAHRLRGRNVKLICESFPLHVDDKLHESNKDGLIIDLRKGLLEFLV